jgi:hypothetical protein
MVTVAGSCVKTRGQAKRPACPESVTPRRWCRRHRPPGSALLPRCAALQAAASAPPNPCRPCSPRSALPPLRRRAHRHRPPPPRPRPHSTGTTGSAEPAPAAAGTVGTFGRASSFGPTPAAPQLSTPRVCAPRTCVQTSRASTPSGRAGRARTCSRAARLRTAPTAWQEPAAPGTRLALHSAASSFRATRPACACVFMIVLSPWIACWGG